MFTAAGFSFCSVPFLVSSFALFLESGVNLCYENFEVASSLGS